MFTSSQFIDWHLTSFSVKVTVIFKDVEALIDRLIKMTKYLTRFIFGRHQEGLFMSSMTLRLKRRTFGWRALTQVKAEGKVTDDDGLSGKRNSAQCPPSAKVIYFWIPFGILVHQTTLFPMKLSTYINKTKNL